MEAKLAITVLLTVSILIATTAIHFESLRVFGEPSQKEEETAG